MNNDETKDFCMNLIHADSEEEVISIIEAARLWNDPEKWRYYGREDNWGTCGNQAARADAAIVEKLTNSVDARLLNECLVRGIDPEGSEAPKSINDAVAVFVKDAKPGQGRFAGSLTEWTEAERADAAMDITLAATGFKPQDGKFCLTISDKGEGQTPSQMPDKLLSLEQGNKLRIPFVQGRFNMGGAGVLRFCGLHNMQLIVSRRNPKLADPADETGQQWGFTILRRESPSDMRNSVFTYLAPLAAQDNPRHGNILRFTADMLPIFPEGKNPYVRKSQWGTLIKLYEYDVPGSRSNMLRRDGLLSRLDLLMPEVALPIRLHECREYGGKKGSFDTNLNGIRVRLEEDKSENLEEDRPWTGPLNVKGEKIKASIFAFKRGRADTYKHSEGILFTINGQTHTTLPKDFFRRKGVGLGYLADSLLVILDCTAFGNRAREDLFMPSRDRLSNVQLRYELEESIMQMLRNHQGLRALHEKRRRELIKEKLGAEKPLEEVLRSVLKSAPGLYSLFLPGKRISNPFKMKRVETEEQPYKGRRFPTYFKFRGKEYGTHLLRRCPIDRRCRIAFDTDAVNDYFDRKFEPGEFGLYIVVAGQHSELSTYALNLHNGVSNLTLNLPANCEVGDRIELVASINDSDHLEPFENRFTVEILDDAGPQQGGDGKKRRPRTDKAGEDADAPTGIQFPDITEVYEEARGDSPGWNDLPVPPFDKYSALRIINRGSDNEDDNGKSDIYDFFVNMDNVFLNVELKYVKADPNITRARFLCGMVLIGLGLLQQDTKVKNTTSGRDSESQSLDSIECQIEKVSKALAPILLPMIDSLGALNVDLFGSARPAAQLG